MPSVVRDRATEDVTLEECSGPGRWFADNWQGSWRLVMAGARAVVLVARPYDPPGPGVKYRFPLALDTIEVRDFPRLDPVPIRSTDDQAGGGGHRTLDAPANWDTVLRAFPHSAQNILEHWFPPEMKATRWCAALRAGDATKEELWALAGTTRRIVYLYAERSVSADPFAGQTATERRRQSAPWHVMAFRAQCARESSGSHQVVPKAGE